VSLALVSSAARVTVPMAYQQLHRTEHFSIYHGQTFAINQNYGIYGMGVDLKKCWQFFSLRRDDSCQQIEIQKGEEKRMNIIC
jgi:hypothetical protein